MRNLAPTRAPGLLIQQGSGKITGRMGNQHVRRMRQAVVLPDAVGLAARVRLVQQVIVRARFDAGRRRA
jgi:hypothetical protein